MNYLLLLLITATVFINGATDACGTIASAVSCGAVSYRRAAILAAVMNIVGGAVSCLFFYSVRESVAELAAFPDKYAASAVYVVMATVIVWACGAWMLGLPTSESHAILAASAGASFALNGKIPHGVFLVLCGLLLSVILSGIAGFFAARTVAYIYRRRTSSCRTASVPFARSQIAAIIASAFLHGSQDTQKFLALMLAAMPVISGEASVGAAILCCTVMGIGTLFGGRKSVRKIGSEMTALTPVGAIASDAANAAVLLILTLAGYPVSTTHTKAIAMLGASVSGCGKPDSRCASGLVSAWFLTFPVCGIMGYLGALVIM